MISNNLDIMSKETQLYTYMIKLIGKRFLVGKAGEVLIYVFQFKVNFHSYARTDLRHFLVQTI